MLTKLLSAQFSRIKVIRPAVIVNSKEYLIVSIINFGDISAVDERRTISEYQFCTNSKLECLVDSQFLNIINLNRICYLEVVSVFDNCSNFQLLRTRRGDCSSSRTPNILTIGECSTCSLGHCSSCIIKVEGLQTSLTKFKTSTCHSKSNTSYRSNSSSNKSNFSISLNTLVSETSSVSILVNLQTPTNIIDIITNLNVVGKECGVSPSICKCEIIVCRKIGYIRRNSWNNSTISQPEIINIVLTLLVRTISASSTVSTSDLTNTHWFADQLCIGNSSSSNISTVYIHLKDITFLCQSNELPSIIGKHCSESRLCRRRCRVNCCSIVGYRQFQISRNSVIVHPETTSSVRSITDRN